MTLLLLGANAVPSMQRKQVLREERQRLEREVRRGELEGRRIAAELDALVKDPFYVERMVVETWHGVPRGAVAFEPRPSGAALVRGE
jgi:hypothetical protein